MFDFDHYFANVFQREKVFFIKKQINKNFHVINKVMVLLMPLGNINIFSGQVELLTTVFLQTLLNKAK